MSAALTAADGAPAPGGGEILAKIDDPEAFRAAVRGWLERTMAAERVAFADDADSGWYERQQWWMAERNKVGMATPHWPSAYGGADLSLGNQIIVAEETARAGAPPMNLFTVSLNHIPATLIHWGTPEQKARYLPGVAQGTVWCQGFSEPNAGSDLAALRTRAVRDGDHYVVTGQKIWSSYSMYAQYCILLTRTDPEAPKHKGITYLILDMTAAGVEVRPLRQANGSAKFAEIFLTDVRIPVENRIGAENEGWQVAQTTLSAERGVLAFEASERFRYELEAFHTQAVRAGAEWLRDPQLTREFARLFGEMQGCRRLLRRLLRDNEAGESTVETVVYVKLINTMLKRKIGDFMLRARGIDEMFVGPSVEDQPDQPMNVYIASFGGTIAGGSNEIMRNVLAERILGMPRS